MNRKGMDCGVQVSTLPLHYQADVVALHGHAPYDPEILRALRQEAHEFLGEDLLQGVRLLDLDGYPERVDGRLDEATFVLRSAYQYGGQHELLVVSYARKERRVESIDAHATRSGCQNRCRGLRRTTAALRKRCLT